LYQNVFFFNWMITCHFAHRSNWKQNMINSKIISTTFYRCSCFSCRFIGYSGCFCRWSSELFDS
jgi:hypothetical protein